MKNRILRRILQEAGQKGLFLITGARQTGKTTLVRKSYSNLRYHNLDSAEEREVLQIMPAFLWARQMGSAVIDEAQKEPSVFEKIKYAWDSGELSLSILLGSSQVLLLKRIRESLAGRIRLYELYPLMLCELLTQGMEVLPEMPRLLSGLTERGALADLFSTEPPRLLSQENGPKMEQATYSIQWGGMPALLPLSDADRRKWLKDYEFTYLERDLSDLARLNDLMPFKKFQTAAAHRSGQLLNYSELARDTGLSVDTARRYLRYLELSYQVLLLQPWRTNPVASVVKTPKLYWLDTGMLRCMTGQWEGVSGALFETWVVSEIWKWIRTTSSLCEMYFYRSHSGVETDLVLKTPRGILGLEIKMRSEVARKDFSSLRKLAALYGEAWLGGVVVNHNGKVSFLSEPNIWTVPAHRLLS